MNIIEFVSTKSNKSKVLKRRAPACSPPRIINKQITSRNKNSPSPQKFDNINKVLATMSATIDVKYIDPENNKILFMKIINEFGQKLIATIGSFSLTNVDPHISDVSIEEITQSSYPEHLSEYMKITSHNGFGIANETKDGITIIRNTDVIHYKFDNSNGGDFHRDKQFVVADIDNIVNKFQVFNKQVYDVIHNMTNTTQDKLFSNIDTFIFDINTLGAKIANINDRTKAILNALISRIRETSLEKVKDVNKQVPALHYRTILSSYYASIDKLLDNIAEMDHHISNDNLFMKVNNCIENIENICNHI